MVQWMPLLSFPILYLIRVTSSVAGHSCSLPWAQLSRSSLSHLSLFSHSPLGDVGTFIYSCPDISLFYSLLVYGSFRHQGRDYLPTVVDRPSSICSTLLRTKTVCWAPAASTATLDGIFRLSFCRKLILRHVHVRMDSGRLGRATGCLYPVGARSVDPIPHHRVAP
ncbi:hypothetical protein GGR56DRAFT_652771 [Xylariaceae sp. FL0804]|nr:hypothetical protein GGR56DRAFT_652771 [Xylariaceae sp. FL0804]